MPVSDSLQAWKLVAVALLLALDLTSTTSEIAAYRKPFAVVRPVEDHTRLSVEEEGLAAIRRIQGPVVPIVVIGPYRSGKSFLLNQLLGVGCTEGFEVGHTRSTQTKGVWMWGEPVVVESGGQKLSLVFMDTEGFESTGKADAYDDRIFALSTFISALLIYNLPETIRESDIEKLSFAVELAEAFFSDVTGKGAVPIEPANMLWLIQRDFLEGKTVKQMVREALSPVDNPHNDKDIAQVNKIRQSLQVIARNSSAFGLAQPHLERTHLCRLAESELDPAYLAQRDALRSLVTSLAQPKLVNGNTVTGPELARLVQEMVAALNARDIPSAGSILEHFNKELLYAVRDRYAAKLEELALPVDEARLQAWHQQAAQAAFARFDKDKFGNEVSSNSGTLREMLDSLITKEFSSRKTANIYESSRICEALETECEDLLERQQAMRLPSTGRFKSKFAKCNAHFNATCVGPSRAGQAERLAKAWRREEGRFRHDYNDKLFNGLIILTLVDILIFRFVFRQSLIETVGWVAFVFLQVYPKLYLNGGSMYDSKWWGVLVRLWELTVYNAVLDLDQWGPILLPAGVLAWVGYKSYKKCLQPRWQKRTKRLKHLGNNHHDIRDLDV